MGSTSSVAHETGVSNHAGHRSISDVADKTIWRGGYNSTSGSRAMVHGLYHAHVGEQKAKAGNEEGAKAEFARARQQAEVFEKSTFGKVVKSMAEAEKYGPY
eukprot:TRINITY_DN77236_c0_g1_i1.p3 TRINITY_DN77236_c0_g1~~TRINITY_DN77236_c0_g1_i1.p3  ORF type:complete len:102 (-),score=24.80 TRINITY_DN77236_c0_g1_i1:24-329(-)